MIQTSGFFKDPSPFPEMSNPGLEFIHETPDGHCLLFKGYRNDKMVVYKTLKPAFRDDPVYQRMLRREYEIGISLKHPGICEMLAWTSVQGCGDCIEMEYIDGCRLDEWLAEHPGDVAQRRRILSDLCDALEYIHRKQVVHKDLKPENILLTRYGFYPKIIDFGLSDADSILTGKDPAGTWMYAAPEVKSGGMAEARSDIYSLGRIMQQMGPEFSAIARKCSAKDIDKRYPSAEAVKRDLEKMRITRRPVSFVIISLLVAAGIAAALFFKRDDPVENLFLEAVEQVRQASMPR